MAADKIIRNSKLDTLLDMLATKLPAIFWRKAETTQVSIDSTPTANSNNLVKSGGVKSYVDGVIPSVPTISTDVEADKASDLKTASPKAVYDFVCPPKASSQPQGGMAPGIFYDLGTLTGAVTISLATPSDASIANEYRFTFVAGSTAPTITWPSSITLWGGNCIENGAPVITGGMTYEASILDGRAIIIEFE